ncbi:ABC transporter substrate-binding protein [Saccharospirillum mangrovi]|uniref:ABC transporter substrate-binding protein n=1 Tax=Saccharospirillum mangrovi TaxID=2161747 RepID=UPI000D35E967|nr:extracellular solute-binding protein [Saccharospirillum mangrovi]
MAILHKPVVAFGAVLLGAAAVNAMAEDYTITVWAGGTNQTSHYRVDAIVMAAELLEREASVLGEDLNITVESQVWSGWDDFKQAVTLAAESDTLPNIIVSGHEDIGPWSQAGAIRPIEDYVDFDAWPLNQLYDNLIDVASYNGQIWGIPQDAESRVFFFSKPKLKAIGYSDAQINNLSERVRSGDYDLYDMLDDVKKMQDEGVVEAGMGFAPRPTNGPDYWQFYQSFGGEMVDADSGKLVFDEQAMTDMYQFFVDAVDMGVVPRTYLGLEWDDWHRNVAAGNYGAWHGGTWHYSQWTASFGLTDFFDNVSYSLIPAGNKAGHANAITHPLVYLLSSSGSDDDAAIAAELIAIASEPRINSLHAVESGHLAIGADQVTVPLYANDYWTSEATEKLLPYANAIPNNADFGIYWDAMFQGLEAAWTGASSVEQAVSAARNEVTSALGSGVIVR